MRKYKYYAIRTGDSVLIRRSIIGLKRITSRLVNRKTGLDVTQITYTGGIVRGALAYTTWYRIVRLPIDDMSYLKITREQALGLTPYFDKDK